MLTQANIANPVFDVPRKLWIQRAISGNSAVCMIVLDAEIYLNSVQAAEIIFKLKETENLPPMDSVYLSNSDALARHHDFACNEAFARFVATDLLRWIKENLSAYKRFFLCGLSLSGLCAVFTALRHPNVFAGVISQSPSAWWNDEWLAASIASSDASKNRIWISVGDRETATNISHSPTGMLQKTSQIASVKRLADRLKPISYSVSYSEFSGGHDTKCWAAELPEALAWVMRENEAETPMLVPTMPAARRC